MASLSASDSWFRVICEIHEVAADFFAFSSCVAEPGSPEAASRCFSIWTAMSLASAAADATVDPRAVLNRTFQFSRIFSGSLSRRAQFRCGGARRLTGRVSRRSFAAQLPIIPSCLHSLLLLERTASPNPACPRRRRPKLGRGMRIRRRFPVTLPRIISSYADGEII